jgi:hypothetical protein
MIARLFPDDDLHADAAVLVGGWLHGMPGSEWDPRLTDPDGCRAAAAAA